MSAATPPAARPGMQADAASGPPTRETQRERFYRLVPELLGADDRLVCVLADIGVSALDTARRADPNAAALRDRIINVGIREQLMIGVAGGLALAGMRPIVHTFAPFLIERPFEQVKLDIGHQGVGAVLVSARGSYGWPEGGETHFGHRDIALLDTLAGWTVHVPGHPDEAEHLLRRAAAGSDRVYVRLDDESNTAAVDLCDARMHILRRGARGTIVAVGPIADRVLAAATDHDVTVLYATTVRPFDVETLKATLTTPDVIIVEPYLADTSTAEVARALADIPHRVRGLGVSREESRRYGTVAEHDILNGLDIAGLRESFNAFFQCPSSQRGGMATSQHASTWPRRP